MSKDSSLEERTDQQQSVEPEPKVVTTKVTIPQVGSCFYHQNLLASFMCARCGRAICRACAKHRGDTVWCPECDAKYPAPPGQQAPPRERAVMGFIFSLTAGALIFANGVLLSAYSSELGRLFPWLLSFDRMMLVFLGVVCGICVLVGAIITYYPTLEVIGSFVVIVFSLAAVIVGGGFIVGVVSGVVGGALAILNRH